MLLCRCILSVSEDRSPRDRRVSYSAARYEEPPLSVHRAYYTYEGQQLLTHEVCSQPGEGVDSRSFHDFWSEDIEKERNVSFSSPEYAGKVLLVVNVASF